MKWKYMFSNVILQRGRQYYERGRVQAIMHNGNRFQAEVVGSVPYEVEAVLQEGKTPYLSCECHYAEDGSYCKHMAALMFAIEDMELPAFSENKKKKRKVSVKKERKLVYPFKAKDQNDEEYRYFDIRQMTEGLIFYEDVCEAAKKLMEQGLVSLSSVDIGYDGSYNSKNISGTACGKVMNNNIEWEVRLDFDREHILRAMCYVPGCFRSFDNNYRYGDKQLCVHETALLFLLADYLQQHNPGDSTDWQAMQLLYAFKGRRFEKIKNEDKQDFSLQELSVPVQLEPRLERNYDGIYLSFRIGRDKKYVVKNLTNLILDIEDGNVMALGKKNEIDFATAVFEEHSKQYLDFIGKCVREEFYRSEMVRSTSRYYDNSYIEIKGSIPLYGVRLDEFFDLAKGMQLNYTDQLRGSSSKRTICLEDKDLEARLSIVKDIDEAGVFHGIELRGDLPEFIEGEKDFYYLDDEHLYRTTREKVGEMTPLLALEENGHLSMHIGRKNLARFYYSVLPVLRKYAAIDEPLDGEIESFLPPEASFVFYLDADANNVFCRVKVLYGDVESTLYALDTNVSATSYRDIDQEENISEQVQMYFPVIDQAKGCFHCGKDQDQIYRVLESGVDRLLTLGEVQSTDRFRHLKIRSRTKVSVGVSVESDIMNLTIQSEDISQEELLEILHSYQKKQRYYRLRNGDFMTLEDENLEALEVMMDTLHLSPKEFVKGKMQVPVYRALYLDKMLEENDGLYTQRDVHYKKLVKEFKTVKDSDFEVPSSLRPTMRKYQIFGHKWIRTLGNCGFGGILADDMGLGKTLQMISVILAAKQENPVMEPALIVCPASLVYNWQEEFARFAPEMSVCVIAGTQVERCDKLKDWLNWDVLITSYDLLKRDIAEYENLHFSYQVIDEAQYIKNHTTAAAKSVKVIHSSHRFALTGTPIENRLSELWSIFDYLMPGFLYGYEVFKKELESPITRLHDEVATEQLKKMVSPFILRRLKGDVLKDLPEKMEEIRYARLDAKQQKLYDGQVVHMQKMLREQSEGEYMKNKLQVLSELTKIRQICCDPELLLDNYNGGSAKREACLELIESAIEGEHKMLVFSQFTTMLEILEKELKNRNIAYYKITGATSKEHRLELVRAFNQDTTPVFLISLKAGGTGLNLTGADVVIHYDPWWNVAAQNQATDRAHRIGQTKAVSVYKLIVKDSIEEKIVRMQEEKQNLADEILSGESGGIVNMSKEDLLELLQ